MNLLKCKQHLMKVAFVMVIAGMMSCKKEDTTPAPNPQPDEQYVVLTGNLETQKLEASKKYLIRGQVFVREGKTLTIEPGTVIMGEKSTKGTLVIDRGGKIMAEGTAAKPIVFTSNQSAGNRDRGDWGGLVILGKAKVNIPSPSVEGITPQVTYGGDDDNDSSGVLKYIRVEFAGIELTPNNETNGITLGGVGRGTVFEHIQVSYGGDDGIEWFGGSVNGKYLVVFGTWDDSFDIDNGFSGNLQFGLAVNYPSYADQSDSNGFEWDTDADNDLTRAKTSVVISNFTIIGPSLDGNSYSANFKHAVDLRRNVAGSIYNSVFLGYPTAIRMNQASVFPNYSNGEAQIANNVFYAKTNRILSGSAVSVADIDQYLQANDNVVQAGADFQTSAAYQGLGISPDLFFGKTKTKVDYPAHPSFALQAGTLQSGAKFDYANLKAADRASAFDTSVTFKGAFGAQDWTQGWTHFDPINATY
jgi:hypothetical protein